MGSDKNSSSGIAASPAMRRQTRTRLRYGCHSVTPAVPRREGRLAGSFAADHLETRLPISRISNRKSGIRIRRLQQNKPPSRSLVAKKSPFFLRATTPCILNSRSVDPPRVTGHDSRTTELLIATFNISRIRLTPTDTTLTYFLTATKQPSRQIPILRASACLQSATVIISNSVEI
jgi:hypothetical protein